MSLLIVYSSKYGATEKTAEHLAKIYGKDTTLLNLKNRIKQDINFERYDSIALGGSIYIGKIQKEVKKFCNKYQNKILNKKLGLFICCGSDDELDRYFKDSFGNKLVSHSAYNAHFGYEYNFDRMNFLNKLIVKKIAGINKSKSNIKMENIKKMAEILK